MAKTTKKLLFAMLMVVVAAFMAFGVMSLSACGEEEPSNTTVTYTVAITGSDVSNDAVALKTGSTTTLSAAVLADGVEDSTLASDIVWSTSSSSVATVSNGTVTAVAAGTANITAAYGTVSAKVSVTVTDIVYTVKITGDDLDEDGALSFDITDGAIHSSVLTATVYADGESTTLAAEWSVSDATVVSCTGGTVIAQAAGTAIVTAYYGTGTATVNVTVTKTEKAAAGSVTLTGTGYATANGITFDASVYLILDLDNSTAKLYEVWSAYSGYVNYTVVTPDGTAYGETATMDGMTATIPEGTITADSDGTYTVTFTYLTYPLTFTVSESEGIYTTSLASLVSFGLLDSETAVSTTDSATTLVGTGYATANGITFDASVYLILDLDNGTAKLYEVWSAYSGYVNYTVVTPDGTAYGGTDTMDGMTATIPEGTITANNDGTYTVTFTYLTYPLTFTITATTDADNNKTYSTSLASLVSFGLLDSITATGKVESEPITITGTGYATANGITFDVSVYLILDLDNGTAKLYEVWSAYSGYVNYTVVTPDGTAYGETDTMDGMTATIPEGTITANNDGTYTVTFTYLTYPLTFTVSESEGVYTTSLASLVSFGLLDSETAVSTTGSATTLVGTGYATANGITFDASVYLILDLDNGTAKLYEVWSAYSGYVNYTVVTPDGTAYGGTDTMDGMTATIPEGTITANNDGTYTVTFTYLTYPLTFTVSESEDTYSTSLASLVSFGLLDSVTATSAVEDTTETTETTESAE